MNDSKANSLHTLDHFNHPHQEGLNGIKIYLRALNVNGLPLGDIYHFYFSHVEMEALTSSIAKTFVEIYVATKSHVLFSTCFGN